MNIFILSLDPIQSAQYHCDQHLSKMILESAQMASTALFHLLPPHKWNLIRNHIYKPTHPNHPCTKWLYDSECGQVELTSRWQYLYLLAHQLQVERRALHASFGILAHCCNEFQSQFMQFTTESPSPIKFARAMPHIFRFWHPLDTPTQTVLAYQSYYRHKKSLWARKGLQMSWDNRPIPEFMLHK